MNLHAKTSTEYISCGTVDGKNYKVAGVSDEVVQANKQQIMNGDIELNISEGAYLNTATSTLEMPTKKRSMNNTSLQFFKEKRGRNDGTKSMFDRSRRRSLATTGTRSALVVRVVASNAAPTLSEATLSDSVFGNGADGTVDPVSMKSHFKTCSHGQLDFVEAADRDGRTVKIRNGMCEAICFKINSFSFAPSPSSSSRLCHHPLLLPTFITIIRCRNCVCKLPSNPEQF